MSQVRPTAVFFGRGGVAGLRGPEGQEKLRILRQSLDPVFMSLDSADGAELKVSVIKLPSSSSPLMAWSAALLFYCAGARKALREATNSVPAAIICQSPYEGFAALAASMFKPRGSRPKIVIEVHGDWRTAGRGYGKGLRRLAAPFAEKAAKVALDRAGLVRVVGDFTEILVRQAGYQGRIEKFPAFVDLSDFLATGPAPFPLSHQAAFVGSLEPVKGPDILLAAWPRVVRAVPGARLVFAGSGSMEVFLKKRAEGMGLGPGVEFKGKLSRQSVLRLIDDSCVVVVPSRSEGLGRVIFEAFARGRPVVGARTGGIPELVDHGKNGLLFPREDASALGEALVDVLGHPQSREAMGRAGHAFVGAADPAGQFDKGMAAVARWISEP
ncbi:MAG: glycosyltransferase family 4 protein [Actinomycetota bacterium]